MGANSLLKDISFELIELGPSFLQLLLDLVPLLGTELVELLSLPLDEPHVSKSISLLLLLPESTSDLLLEVFFLLLQHFELPLDLRIVLCTVPIPKLITRDHLPDDE